MAPIMVFGLGPVLRYELITTARRGRYYMVRVAYGLLLLFSLWNQYQDWEARHPGGGKVDEVHRFAESAFIDFAGAQGLALLGLVPALVAGVIADEHQRRTLHYLLASRLSSAEIVLGKLGARLVHVGTFVALGLPVVCLLALYGGLNPIDVYYVYFGTFTMVLFVAGFSILISIVARRPRDAILAAYALEAIWLLGPPAIAPFAYHLGWAFGWVGPVNDWTMMCNPMIVWQRLTNRSQMIAFNPGWAIPFWFSEFEPMFYWMVGLQGGVGLLLLVLAIAGLRPLRGGSWPGAKPRTGWWTRLAGRVQAAARTRAGAALARNELLTASARPPCGEAPMLWKEQYATMGGGLRWLGSRPVVLFFSVLLGCYLLDVANPVVRDLFGPGRHGMARMVMTAALRETSTALAILGMLAVGASAAVSLTGEREQDTWVSLATTLLTPGEIIVAKQFGAIWSGRWVALALMVTWAVGLLLGALHPLGVAAACGILLLAAWFLAAAGVFISGRARNSTRALAWTFLVLFLTLGRWPALLWQWLGSWREVAALWSPGSPAALQPGALTPDAPAALALTAAVAATAAGLLTFWAARRLRATWGQP
jgi:hypothetical protein